MTKNKPRVSFSQKEFSIKELIENLKHFENIGHGYITIYPAPVHLDVHQFEGVYDKVEKKI